MAGERAQLAASICFPQLDRLVPTAAGYRLPIRAKGYRSNLLRVSGKRP